MLITNLSSDAITIPIGSTFTETYANQTWVLNKNLAINPNSQQYVTLYTITEGEFIVPSGITFNYNGSLPLACVSYTSSSGGSDIESISSLRNRISQGTGATSFLIQAKRAIELLSGIESCTIWMNTSSTENLVIGQNTSSKVLVTITNTDKGDITFEAGTILTDNSLNKQGVL